MTINITHPTRLFVAGVSALAVVASLALPAHAKVVPPTVPSALMVPAGNIAILVGHATGTQNYACTAASPANVWTFAGPQATLYGDNGHQIATHFAVPGSNPPVPEWQATDGSTVVGHKQASATEDPTAIPWLLLSAASTTTGPDGGDRLSATTYVQRVNTTGGLAPTTACNVGDTADVPYTADYYFYQAAD